VWRRWVEARLAFSPKPTLLALEQHMKTCQRLGAAQAAKAIDYSIAGGYRAIFEPLKPKLEPPKRNSIGQLL
jgi:hypothetical protein